MLILIVIGCFCVFTIIKVVIQKQKIKKIIEDIELQLNMEELKDIDVDWEDAKQLCYKNDLNFTLKVQDKIYNIIKIVKKYRNSVNNDDLKTLINGKYFLGMTIEMVKDIKGLPNDVNKTESNKGVKLEYVYGNKSSGDVLIFLNGLLIKYTDR